jgi:cytochrome P450
MTDRTDDPDILGPEAVADPYRFFGDLREEDPVHWSASHRSWVITRYDDVAESFLDKRLSSNRVQAIYDRKLTAEQQVARSPTYSMLADWMVFKDPPDHTRMRNLAKRAFTPRAVAALTPQITEVIDQILDLPEAGEVDVLHDIAYPIPAIVIAAMLGVPPEDRDLFRAWSNDISRLVFEGARTEESRAESQAGLVALSDYLRELMIEHRRNPGDNLMSTLIQAHEGDDALSTDEIVNTCVLLLFGGHETTTNLLANGFLALLREPEQARILLEHPEAAVSAVEELNRFDGPAKMVVRRAGEDIETRGKKIEADQRVLLIQASANRDPRKFDQPDRVDLLRTENRNVAFGFGIHYCLGAPLARLETQIALPKMLQKLRNAEVADTVEYAPLLLTRSLVRLPVNYG